MKSMFSKFFLAPVVLAAAALATSSATAETVKVPFQFTAAGQVCPAGYYTVSHDSTENFITLASKSSAKSFTWVVGPGAPDPTDRKIALNFDKVGGAHVLESIQYGAMVTAKLDKKTLRDMERSAQLTGGR